MVDKLRRTHPLNITFSEGEQPTAAKLTAIASQARTGARTLEKAVGDLWNQSGDSILSDWPLQIPNLARMVGESKWLNPVLYPVTEQFTYTDNVGVTYQGKNQGYLRFKPASLSSITGSGLGSNRVASDDLVRSSGDYWVDSATGRFLSFGALAAAAEVSYTVDSSGWAITDSNTPNVIPDPRQTEFTGCRISSVSGVYYIHLPPRRPLTLSGFDKPERYPPSSDFADNEANSITPYKLWQYSTVALADIHYRYPLPQELSEVIDGLAEGTALPDGFLYLWDQTTNTVVEDAVFKKSSLGDWIFEISSTSADLASKVTANENQSSYNSSNYSIIVAGNPIARSIYALYKTIYNSTHNNKGDFSPIVSHDDLEGLNHDSPLYIVTPPSTLATNGPWFASNWSNDGHTSLLSRRGSFGTDSAYYRDVNDNAMLGDLVLGSTNYATDANLGISNRLNVTYDSQRLWWGSRNSSISPYMYVQATGVALPTKILQLKLPSTDWYYQITDGTTEANFYGGIVEVDKIYAVNTQGGKAGIFGNNGATATFNVTVQSSDPTGSLLSGDIYLVTPGKMRIYNGSTWDRLVAQSKATVAASTAVTATSETEFDQYYEIPANTLNIGATIRLKAYVRITSYGTSRFPRINVRLGTGAIASRTQLAAFTATVSGGSNDVVLLDLVATVRTAGVSGTIMAITEYSANDTLFDLSAPAASFVNATTSAQAVDTSIANTISVSGYWNAGAGSPSMQLEMLIVDVQ